MGSFRERCGGRGLRVGPEGAPRAFFRPPVIWLESTKTQEQCLLPWAHRASPRFDSQPLYPTGRRQALSGHPSAIIRSNGRSSRRSPPRRGTTTKLSRAYGKSVPSHMQRTLARMKTCCGRAVWCARPLYNSNVSCEVKSYRWEFFKWLITRRK